MVSLPCCWQPNTVMQKYAAPCSTLALKSTFLTTVAGIQNKKTNQKNPLTKSTHNKTQGKKTTNKLLLIVGYLIDVEVVICMLCCLCCRTALMLATESSAVSVVEVLVQRGADQSAVDTEGHDVLHYAKVSGSSEAKTALSAALNKHPVSGKS